MIRVFLFSLLFLLVSSTRAQNSAIEISLFELPDVVFKPIEVPEGYRAAYELRIKQPIDHNDLSKGYFYQRAFLSHKGFDKPMVMVTEGYDQPRNVISELSRLLDANQLVVEHRYYGHSLPDEIDYTYLNLQQATSDLHYVNTLFKKLYAGKWLSTGISKGGQTTIYYRYFYPNDIDVSIPYVAPFNLELDDKRIYSFLDTIGTQGCRERIRNLQIQLLKNREDVLKYLRWYSFGAGLNFTYLSLEEAFEYSVLEYPFSFWQWGYGCDDIPDTTASIEALLVHLLNISNIDFFSDSDIEKYASHYFQAATEMGYYGYQTDTFKAYLKVLPDTANLKAVFVPKEVKAAYDGTLSKNVYKWIQEKGDHFIYIYGSTDTWSATAIQAIEERDALWFFLQGEDHAGARIINMSDQEQQLLITTLERWLDIKIEPVTSFMLQQ
jgi:hypothetical protein